MTTPDTTAPTIPEDGSVDDLIAFLASAAAAAPEGQVVQLAAGTFALYPMPDGGLMFVTSVAEGPLAGTKHTRIRPQMVRAVTALAGGSKLGAVKAMLGRGRHARG